MPPVTKAAAAKSTMQRYLVRRDTGEVWIWTEMLANSHKDLEEVFARSAEEAKLKRAIPDPRSISIEQLEQMSKADLILFGTIKMQPPVEVNDSMKIDELLDALKEAIFTRPPSADSAG